MFSEMFCLAVGVGKTL